MIQPMLRGTGPTECAPHGRGNIYAPEVRLDDGRYRMWYGGQGRDGHDRIHLAVGLDGMGWTRRGVVLDDPGANHVNDPSVVRVGRAYWMFYTAAVEGVIDRIDAATSADGIHWDRHGPVITPSPGRWDGLLVGRPSVILENGTFRMWFDGRAALDRGRSVGYATSRDGLSWDKHPEPVYTDAGAVDVKRVRDTLVMAYESIGGTMIATSLDGLSWEPRGLWLPLSGWRIDRAGHVTPMLFLGPRGRLDSAYVGAAAHPSWAFNSIAKIPVNPRMVERIVP